MIKKLLILNSYLKTAHYAESALLEKVIKESFIKNASQIDDAKKEHPEHSDKIDRLNSELNNARLIKYLSWSLEELIDSEFQEDPAEIVQVLKDYERLKSKKEVKEKIKDINSWGAAALKRFLDKVSETSQSIRNREKIKRDSESEIIYDSDNFTVILPKTHFASCQWTGKSTKWCVSMERNTYFTDYSNNNYFLYHIFNKDSALPDNDPNKRIAVPTIGDKFDQKNLVNSLDITMSEEEVRKIIGEEWNQIKQAILNYSRAHIISPSMDENFKKIATKLLKDEDINYDEFEKIINISLNADSFWLNLIKRYLKKHDVSSIIQYIFKYTRRGNDLSREYIEELFDVSEAEKPMLDLGLTIFLLFRYPEQFSIDDKISCCEILLNKQEDFELPTFMPFISSILIQNERGKNIFKENIKYFREQVRFGDEEQRVAARNVLKSIPEEYLSLLNK